MQSKISDFCHSGTEYKIAAIDWYNGNGGYLEPNVPCLAVCYEDGWLQLFRNQRDTRPIKLNTQLKHILLKWNVNGSILAIAGVQYVKNANGEEKESCVLQFWDPYGNVLLF
jgi:WD repeat-containing protein 35